MIKCIGIIGAMDEEVSILKEMMKVEEIRTIASMDFYKGTYDGKEIVVVRSGIGKVNAAVCTQILADLYHVEAVINTGVAGALNAEIKIGDIVIATTAQQHDMDATGFGYQPGEIPRMKCSIFEADPELRTLLVDVCKEVNQDISVHTGKVVSGDQFVQSHEVKERLIKVFDGYCTEMEGAAIAQAAYLNNIPFAIVRAISDQADGSAHMDYKEFEMKAIEHTVHLMTGVLKKL